MKRKLWLLVPLIQTLMLAGLIAGWGNRQATNTN